MQRLDSQPRPVRKAPSIPTILIEDRTATPITTTRYISHDNEIDFEAVYKRIKALRRHPQCSHRPSAEYWPCPTCEATFSEEFWSCAAHLLDYFADFLHLDTALMQDAWFHLLDTWQESVSFFPCAVALANLSVSADAVQTFVKARWLSKNSKDTLALMDSVIHGIKNKKVPRQPIIHNPGGEGEGALRENNMGPYISGLKPWQQFLCDGGPGVAEEEDPEAGEAARTCYLPLAGINIIKTHTARARMFASIAFPEPEDVAEFDKMCLKFPADTNTEAQSYQSLNDATVSYRLMDGAPPIVRQRGYAEIKRKHPRPTLSMLDEFVGVCKGIEPYPSVSGGEQEHDDDEEEDDGEMAPFDLWVVTEHRQKEKNGAGKTV